MIHQVAPPSHAELSRPLPSDRAMSWGGVAADRALNQQRAADQSPGQHVSNRDEIPVPPSIVKDRQHTARPIAGGDHPVGLGGGQSHHLVDHAIAAGVERLHGKLGMCVVRRGQDHELDHGILECLLKAGIATDVPVRDPSARTSGARATIPCKARSGCRRIRGQWNAFPASP